MIYLVDKEKKSDMSVFVCLEIINKKQKPSFSSVHGLLKNNNKKNKVKSYGIYIQLFSFTFKVIFLFS